MPIVWSVTIIVYAVQNVIDIVQQSSLVENELWFSYVSYNMAHVCGLNFDSNFEQDNEPAAGAQGCEIYVLNQTPPFCFMLVLFAGTN
jgi:hypothetical protein